MHKDPRGGHNQKTFNEDFFKTWSPPMAYVLSFISADGSVTDARKSSRTCYIGISNNDLDLLKQIKKILRSNHKISIVPAKYREIRSKTYFCKEGYKLRFGSKTMFQDLINLGVTPRKSLRLKLPPVPEKFFSFFLRGYFDGDGCVYFCQTKTQNPVKLQVIFTSGSKKFLEKLSLNLENLLNINATTRFSGNGAYQIRYRKFSSIKILKYIYQGLSEAPYLERKYNKYLQNLNLPSPSTPSTSCC